MGYEQFHSSYCNIHIHFKSKHSIVCLGRVKMPFFYFCVSIHSNVKYLENETKRM
jgi:hypothetical protein